MNLNKILPTPHMLLYVFLLRMEATEEWADDVKVTQSK